MTVAQVVVPVNESGAPQLDFDQVIARDRCLHIVMIAHRRRYPDTVSQLMAKSIKAYNDPGDAAARPPHPLPHARLHDLRHVHATMLLLAGVPVHVVADRLGHADPSITLRVYAHVIRQHAAGIADVFAAAVEPESDDPGDGPEPSALAPC
ncbi:tyrosine-type recombinase/integrase [Kribbella swartbergensis]